MVKESEAQWIADLDASHIPHQKDGTYKYGNETINARFYAERCFLTKQMEATHVPHFALKLVTGGSNKTLIRTVFSHCCA
jgi:hypothetical protein